jgi:NADH dehydrogenase [ubiquinone] 1 alpha subcomplex assembly factor 7
MSLRHMTELRDEIAALIVAEGPLSVARYMALCLGHPRHGYYMVRDPFGAAGDFTTAPEISQMFGELIGLWAASIWQGMGSPPKLRLVELGPGRGSLMSDALRAARALPAFRGALSVHMVEMSPVLRRAQQSALNAMGVEATWHDTVDTALDGPVILIANEFLDALPLSQFVRSDAGWRERLVGLNADGALAFGLGPVSDIRLPLHHPPGTLIEMPQASDGVVRTVARHVAKAGGAALFIDYGSMVSGTGDTLQAVKAHAFVDPLAEPGMADLTVQVNFERVAYMAEHAGAATHGPTTQGAFLEALGLATRAEVLKRKATSAQAKAIDAAVARLTAVDAEGLAGRGMGALFKVLAVADPALPLLPGFETFQLPT